MPMPHPNGFSQSSRQGYPQVHYAAGPSFASSYEATYNGGYQVPSSSGFGGNSSFHGMYESGGVPPVVAAFAAYSGLSSNLVLVLVHLLLTIGILTAAQQIMSLLTFQLLLRLNPTQQVYELLEMVNLFVFLVLVEEYYLHLRLSLNLLMCYILLLSLIICCLFSNLPKTIIVLSFLILLGM